MAMAEDRTAPEPREHHGVAEGPINSTVMGKRPEGLTERKYTPEYLAELVRTSFRSPYLGNTVSWSNDYELARARGRHDAVERLRHTRPDLFAAIQDGDAPVIRLQCPHRHHLARVHMVIEGSPEYPKWQLRTLDNVAPSGDVEPDSFFKDGTRMCTSWVDEVGGDLCGESFTPELLGQWTCPRHGSKLKDANLLSRAAFICEKCAQKRGGGKHVKTIEDLWSRYFLAASLGRSAVTVDGEPFPDRRPRAR